MYKATLKAWVAMLGVDPNDVFEVRAYPDHVEVDMFERDAGGLLTLVGEDHLAYETKTIRVLD